MVNKEAIRRIGECKETGIDKPLRNCLLVLDAREGVVDKIESSR